MNNNTNDNSSTISNNNSKVNNKIKNINNKHNVNFNKSDTNNKIINNNFSKNKNNNNLSNVNTNNFSKSKNNSKIKYNDVHENNNNGRLKKNEKSKYLKNVLNIKNNFADEKKGSNLFNRPSLNEDKNKLSKKRTTSKNYNYLTEDNLKEYDIQCEKNINQKNNEKKRQLEKNKVKYKKKNTKKKSLHNYTNKSYIKKLKYDVSEVENNEKDDLILSENNNNHEKNKKKKISNIKISKNFFLQMDDDNSSKNSSICLKNKEIRKKIIIIEENNKLDLKGRIEKKYLTIDETLILLSLVHEINMKRFNSNEVISSKDSLMEQFMLYNILSYDITNLKSPLKLIFTFCLFKNLRFYYRIQNKNIYIDERTLPNYRIKDNLIDTHSIILGMFDNYHQHINKQKMSLMDFINSFYLNIHNIKFSKKNAQPKSFDNFNLSEKDNSKIASMCSNRPVLYSNYLNDDSELNEIDYNILNEKDSEIINGYSDIKNEIKNNKNEDTKYNKKFIAVSNIKSNDSNDDYKNVSKICGSNNYENNNYDDNDKNEHKKDNNKNNSLCYVIKHRNSNNKYNSYGNFKKYIDFEYCGMNIKKKENKILDKNCENVKTEIKEKNNLTKNEKELCFTIKKKEDTNEKTNNKEIPYIYEGRKRKFYVYDEIEGCLYSCKKQKLSSTDGTLDKKYEELKNCKIKTHELYYHANNNKVDSNNEDMKNMDIVNSDKNKETFFRQVVNANIMGIINKYDTKKLYIKNLLEKSMKIKNEGESELSSQYENFINTTKNDYFFNLNNNKNLSIENIKIKEGEVNKSTYEEKDLENNKIIEQEGENNVLYKEYKNNMELKSKNKISENQSKQKNSSIKREKKIFFCNNNLSLMKNRSSKRCITKKRRHIEKAKNNEVQETKKGYRRNVNELENVNVMLLEKIKNNYKISMKNDSSNKKKKKKEEIYEFENDEIGQKLENTNINKIKFIQECEQKYNNKEIIDREKKCMLSVDMLYNNNFNILDIKVNTHFSHNYHISLFFLCKYTSYNLFLHPLNKNEHIVSYVILNCKNDVLTDNGNYFVLRYLLSFLNSKLSSLRKCYANALYNSYLLQIPVRIFRHNNLKTKYSPNYGIRYDGIYKIVNAFTINDYSTYEYKRDILYVFKRLYIDKCFIPNNSYRFFDNKSYRKKHLIDKNAVSIDVYFNKEIIMTLKVPYLKNYKSTTFTNFNHIYKFIRKKCIQENLATEWLATDVKQYENCKKRLREEKRKKEFEESIKRSLEKKTENENNSHVTYANSSDTNDSNKKKNNNVTSMGDFKNKKKNIIKKDKKNDMNCNNNDNKNDNNNSNYNYNNSNDNNNDNDNNNNDNNFSKNKRIIDEFPYWCSGKYLPLVLILETLDFEKEINIKQRIRTKNLKKLNISTKKTEIAINCEMAKRPAHLFIPIKSKEAISAYIELKKPFCDSWNPYEDLSAGKEKFKIPVENVVDDALPPMNFTYVNKTIFFSRLPPYNLLPLCSGCAPKNYNKKDYDELYINGYCKGLRHRRTNKIYCDGNKNYDINDFNVLAACSGNCLCDPLKCTNKFPEGLHYPVKVVKTKDIGWDIVSCSYIKANSLIMHYVGEITTRKEMISREHEYDKKGYFNYFIETAEVDETYPDDWKIPCIDALFFSNVARFLNHSCEPNVNVITIWRGDSYPSVGIFASRDIHPNEPLKYHYGINYKNIKCMCASKKCKGYIG